MIGKLRPVKIHLQCLKKQVDLPINKKVSSLWSPHQLLVLKERTRGWILLHQADMPLYRFLLLLMTWATVRWARRRGIFLMSWRWFRRHLALSLMRLTSSNSASRKPRLWVVVKTRMPNRSEASRDSSYIVPRQPPLIGQSPHRWQKRLSTTLDMRRMLSS